VGVPYTVLAIGGVITSVLFSLGFWSTLVAEFVLFGVERLRGHDEPTLARPGGAPAPTCVTVWISQEWKLVAEEAAAGDNLGLASRTEPFLAD
jgi:hypothetical protein